MAEKITTIKSMGKKVTKLTKKQAKDLGEFGAFSVHLTQLLNERGMTSQDFSQACKAAGLKIEDHAIRSWIRAESMPKSHQLRALGKVLGLSDPRHILPG